MTPLDSLDLHSLAYAYNSRAVSPQEVIREVYARITRAQRKGVWIQLVPEAEALARARELDLFREHNSVTKLPLFGIPFAIKDNIDLAGVPTTAACREFAYTPARSAFAVQKLLDAGAIAVGKTNLDQFAAGLAGTRSPFGACENAFDPQHISGGSSAGSAVAVALGQVSFALGTDTAGGGRIPAAFNNIVGFKPTRGMLSPGGTVPACRSLDCVSILALTCSDAVRVLDAARGYDDSAIYSRLKGDTLFLKQSAPAPFRFGVPQPFLLQLWGNAAYSALFDQAIARLERLGGERVEIDFLPFREATELYHGGLWWAERIAGLESFYRERRAALHPETAEVFAKGETFSAVHVFQTRHKLEDCKRRAHAEWKKMDVLLTPTAAALPTVAEAAADPAALNTRLGYYASFTNLLDCCALALPAGVDAQGLPFGISLTASAFRDGLLLALGAEYQRSLNAKLGATNAGLPARKESASALLHKTSDPNIAAAAGI